MKPSQLDTFIEDIADRVAERVAAKLGHIAVAVYTTARRGPHVPGKSRDWMRRNVRAMPGSRKVGRDWIISSDDYQKWAAAHDVGTRRVAKVTPSSSVEALAEAALATAGYRPTRKRVA